jgi:cell division protease FtsH
MILAATNRPEILDPALLRPGRFDRQVVLDGPDRRGREKILKVHVRDVPLAPGLDLSLMAARTPDFVGADLANLVNEAALHAAGDGKEAVDTVDFDEAIDRVVGGLERRSRVINPKEKEIVAYHEAGHALVAESREHVDHVAKISVIPRRVAALGYTQQQSTEDRYLMTRAADAEARGRADHRRITSGRDDHPSQPRHRTAPRVAQPGRRAVRPAIRE